MSYTTLFLPTPIISIIGGTGSSGVSGSVVLRLPLPALYIASDAVPAEANVALALPAIILAIDGAQSAIGDVTLALPQMALQSDGFQLVRGEVALSLPALSLTILVDQTGALLRLPAPELVATGVVGHIGSVRLKLPDMLLEASGVTGAIANVALRLPSYALLADGYAENRAAVSLGLPLPRMLASGGTGTAGRVVLALPTPTMAIAGQVAYVGSVALHLRPTLQVEGATGGLARISLTLRSLALAVSGGTGTVGSASMTLPVMAVSASGVSSIVGAVTLSVPMLTLHATGARTIGANFSTVAMHTESGALTTYAGYEFNSFAQFNGVYLGAKSDGIFALSGATDAGVLIDAAARVGITDFGTSHLKRVERCYVGYSTDGAMILRVVTDGDATRDYRLLPTGKSGVHGNHVRIGRGVEARYWQFEILNMEGADFSLDMLEFKPTTLHRRIGGGNA